MCSIYLQAHFRGGDVVYVKDDSLTIPDTSAISERALSEVPEGFTAVKVETGLVTDDYVEIVSGLSEGQEIYVSETESSGMGMFGGMTMTFSGGPGGGGSGGGGPVGGGMRR